MFDDSTRRRRTPARAEPALLGALVRTGARPKCADLETCARMRLIGTLTRLWAERGSRPPAPRD